jgi:hypothetical protein
MHAEDRRLRRVDDRRRQHRAEGAAVGNREGAAGQVFQRQLAVLGLLAELGDLLFDLGQAHLVGVAQDRHDQAARAADGDADVEVAVIDDVVAIHRGIDHRVFLQRGNGGLDEEGHEAELDAVLLLEALLVLLAHLHDRGHVDLVEGGQDGVGRLRLHQALGDAGPQARHRHALLGAIGDDGIGIDHVRLRQRGLARSRGLGRGNRSCRRLGLGAAADVFLEDATATPAALHVGGGDTLFVHDLARGRHRSRGCRGGRGRRRGGGLGCCGSGHRALGFGIDLGDDFTRDHHLAGVLDDLDDHAGVGSRQFENHLVGFDVDQVLIAGDGVTLLDVPGRQCGFGNGL